MTYDDLITQFGTQAAAARALGVTRGCVCQWRNEGIPALRQFQIERVTEGALTADVTRPRGATGEAPDGATGSEAV